MGDDDHSDGDDLSFKPGAWRSATPDGNPLFAPRGLPVQESEDLERILKLPRRPPVVPGSATSEALIEIAMQKYGRGPRACRCAEIAPGKPCITRLLPIQAWALHEIHLVNGLIASIPVGGGKCLAPETEVFDYKAGRRRRLDEVGGLSVATYEDRHLRVVGATAFPSGMKLCTRVTLRDGSSVLASTDHPILTARGWVRAWQITTEDLVAVPRMMPEPLTCTQASDEEVSFVAYMLSDGGCSQHALHFTNATPSVIEDWTCCASTLGYRVAETTSRTNAREFRLNTGSRDLSDGRWSSRYASCRSCQTTNRRHLGRGLCSSCYQKGKGSIRDQFQVESVPPDPIRKRWGLFGLAKDKRLHADLWGLSRRQVALFLNRFWACDGHVSKSGLEVTLASELMVDDLRFMLLRLGVRSRKRFKKAGYTKDNIRREFAAWRLMIHGADAARFLEQVGDVLGKETACQWLRARLAATKRNTNFDVVPIGEREMHEICDELGFPRRGQGVGTGARSRAFRGVGSTRGQCLSRDTFIRFCREFGYHHGKYTHLATEDVAWERVESVKGDGFRPVYDLNVPETGNFVANGMIVHNTAIGCLAPLALRNCPLCLLLVPPSLIDQIIVDYQLIAEHFNVPALTVHVSRRETRKWNQHIKTVLHVLPYSQLSSPESSAWLDNLRPDAIICDEVDAVASLDSSRSLRILRHFSQHWQTTRFCGWTGSITDKSLSEVAHLAALALREGSPMPHDRMVTDEWGRCLDAVPNPCPPGALIRFLGPGEGIHDVRKAYRRRLAETPGFIMVEGRQEVIAPSRGVQVGFSIRERQAPPIPDIIQRALASVRDGIRPDTMAGAQDDEILVDPLEQSKCAREVAAGLMYRWEFPPIDGQPQSRDLIRDWYAARKAWNSELRHKVLRGEVHLDSPKLCENAARRFYGEMPKDKDLPEWEAENWPVWRDIKDSVKYNTVAVRLDSFLVDDAARWASEHKGIVWYGMVEAAIWCAERARELFGIFIPVHGGGPGAGERIVKERGDRSILASIKSHGRGRDRLQYVFAEQLLLNIPSSARVSQQLYGRLLRRGQDAAEVTTDAYLHTKELRAAFEQSIRRAEYVTDITGEEQSLLIGWQGSRDLSGDD